MNSELPKRWRSSRIESEAVKACARAHGVSDRSVRDWRLSADPRWTKWLTARAAERVGELELPALRAAGKTSSPEVEEEFAVRRLVLLQNELDSMIARGEASSLPPMIKALNECQKLVHSCRLAKLEHQERAGRLMDASAARKMVSERITALRVVMENMPDELAGRVNPSDPNFAHEILLGWRDDRWNRAMRGAAQGLDDAPVGGAE